MPSRPAAAAIILFWLGVVGYLGYTRVLPWLTASDAPAVTVSATDEASRMKVRWVVLLKTDDRAGFEKAGSLLSELKADDADTYTFLAKYTDIKLKILTFAVRVPSATTEVTIDRAGHLRRQVVRGSGVFSPPPLLAQALGGDLTASADVTSHVVAGELRGRVEGTVLGVKLDAMDLPPVPVPAGQVLNPLLPVNRLSGVEPGKTWRIRQVDPLGDSLRQLAIAFLQKNNIDSKLLGGGGTGEGEELLAEVRADTETLTNRRNDEPVPCRVIEYRGKDNKVVARTWVAADGRVMRQEATASGNTLRLDRDE